MARTLCLPFFFICHVLPAQQRAEFKAISKMKGVPSRRLGFAFNDRFIYVREQQDYQLYSFSTNTWERLKIPDAVPPSFHNASVYLPGFERVFTFNKNLEILDLLTLKVSYVEIVGGRAEQPAIEFWQNKIYLIGATSPAAPM